MRFITRLHAVVSVAIVGILCLGWILPSSRLPIRIQKAWKGTSHRLVVFGDDWSDTGEYRVSPPPKSTIEKKDPDRGDIWTQVLCREVVCDYVDNFARSMPSNVNMPTVGSVVDSDIYSNATAERNEEALALFDFQTQMQQFMNFEKQNRLMPTHLAKPERTIFTVFFGIWDLLEYSALEKAKAVHAIDCSIEELFHNLNLLREHAGGPIEVVIPKVVDVTFLPLFQERKNESTSGFAQDQHQSVFLWTYWNTALSQAALRWRGGDIFMPDLNGIVMNQVRAKQLFSEHISDASGFGKQMPLFDDVERPCLISTPEGIEPRAAEVEKCLEPARHLFWPTCPPVLTSARSPNQVAFQRNMCHNRPRNRSAPLVGQKLAAWEGGSRTKKINWRSKDPASVWIISITGSSAGQGGSAMALPADTPKMLANRMLPPPNPPPLPVATFYNIPRRYFRSAMHPRDENSTVVMEDPAAGRNLRKSIRATQSRNTSSPTVAEPTRDSRGPMSSPQSPPMMTRKRAASLNEQINRGVLDDTQSPVDSRSSYSAPSTASGDLSGHVCLCQPEPKIPRPRNAFILYRQYHQSAIVARNPGLANPEVSKIIGEQWKAEDDESKKYWQVLAQEEKDRHHERYPDYRYQPRRVGRPGSLPSNPSGQPTTVDKYRCPHCGGRSIKTPTSPFPLSAGTPLPSSSGTPTLPPPTPSELAPTSRYMPMMSGISLDSPAHRRRGPGPSNLSSIHAPQTPSDAPLYSPMSPGSKKRRYQYPHASNGRRPEAAYYTQPRRDSQTLPPISHMTRQSPPVTATMPPPRTPRRQPVDLNLLVPNQHDQSRSVEAMVMSVPYNVKVKVLGRITPPLKEPGPTSPAIRVRGAILAIEGDNTSAVKEMAEWLKDFLLKDQGDNGYKYKYSPRISEPPKVPKDSQKDVTFEEYLDLIKEWHGRSKEMIGYITTPVSTDSPDSSNSTSSPRKDSPNLSSSSSPLSQDSATKPVVILPTYQLRAADVYTSRIPIQDAYSPTDHWQWMATLWRGTVGPDLTIYVQNADPKDTPPRGGKLVEVNEEGRYLTVKREKGGAFDEGALRRVGFEVKEWIHGVGGRKTG
ncbi:hypothetical protein BCR34DRAFT_590673 [Clohesyomyces aquaticus]|uniref:HMG box domain-containing protein n=1 Tax=Clohesyomyces aquaticus TaxID=1231657 RepID=A0A1Y1Z7J3_9PLEO|nr:hypothetical protein BCR34DRAFT_590673 [Clohesyomyces aquaticus]